MSCKRKALGLKLGHCALRALALLTAYCLPPIAGGAPTLSWRDNSDNETGFRIERSDDGLQFWTLNYVARDITRYEDSTAVIGAKYFWRVVAYNTRGDSEPSNVVSAVVGEPTVPAPTDETVPNRPGPLELTQPAAVPTAHLDFLSTDIFSAVSSKDLRDAVSPKSPTAQSRFDIMDAMPAKIEGQKFIGETYERNRFEIHTRYYDTQEKRWSAWTAYTRNARTREEAEAQLAMWKHGDRIFQSFVHVEGMGDCGWRIVKVTATCEVVA